MTEEIQLKDVQHGELSWDTDYNTNFETLKQAIEGKSDGVVTHIMTEADGLVLGDGVTSAILMIMEFKDSELVIMRANFDTSIKLNTWVDTVTAPTSLFKGYKGKTDYLPDINWDSPNKAHVLCDTNRGAFPAFVYGSSAQANSYACRMFLLHN